MMRSHPAPAAAALLADTDSSMNPARIKEIGVSEKKPMQTFIDALTLAPSLEPRTAAHAVGQIKCPLVQSIRRGLEKPDVSERHERAKPIWIRSAYLPYGPAAL
jgi:hypothetical protein